MAQQYPPKKNDTAGYTFYISLVSQANTKLFMVNPTLAAGDAQLAIDDGAPANLGTLPVVDADFTKRVKVVLSQAETNGDNLTLILSDAAGAEWCDLTINLQTVSERLQARLPAALTAGGNMKADTLAIDGSTDAAGRLQKSAEGIVFCTVGAASTTTSIVTSAMDPAAAVTDQFKGRIVTFKRDTTTANLRGQSTDITASTSGGVLTVTALTTAPVSGDTFTIN